MAIIRRFPTSYAGPGTNQWTYEENLMADDGNYGGIAYFNNKTIYVYGFGFSIPETATINSVTIEVEAKKAGSDNSPFLIQIAYNGSLRGTQLQQTLTTSDTKYRTSLTGTWTVAELNSSLLQVYLTAGLVDVTVDYVVVEVDCTLPSTAKRNFAQII